MKLFVTLDRNCPCLVAPYAGAWIETESCDPKEITTTSPLMQGRGLKRDEINSTIILGYVAPYAGAWIETNTGDYTKNRRRVAPYAGAWIETVYVRALSKTGKVAPYAGAWIETHQKCGGIRAR